MTDKFIPFNPETAKNGDTVYYIGERFLFVGVNPKYHGECFLIRPGGTLILANNSGVTVKAPKKTVWVNVYNYRGNIDVFSHITKETAEENIGQNPYFVGTYPLEIDDVA